MADGVERDVVFPFIPSLTPPVELNKMEKEKERKKRSS